MPNKTCSLSSLSTPESGWKSPLPVFTGGWSLNAVRNALRSGDRTAIERDVTPLYTHSLKIITRFAQKLVTKGERTGLNINKDSEDLAYEAFDKVFRLIVGVNGDKIQNEQHLLRILLGAVRCLWVDALRLPDTQRIRLQPSSKIFGSEPVSNLPTPELALFGKDKTAFVALQILFLQGEQFGRLLRKSKVAARHYRQYQALALYELSERMRSDLLDVEIEARSAIVEFWRHFAQDVIGLSPQKWQLLEFAVTSSLVEFVDTETYLYDSLRIAVKEICEADLQNRIKRHVMRHEMGQFFTNCHAELERLGNS